MEGKKRVKKDAKGVVVAYTTMTANGQYKPRPKYTNKQGVIPAFERGLAQLKQWRAEGDTKFRTRDGVVDRIEGSDVR